MSPTEDHLDVLQNIEAAVVEVWNQNPALNNYNVMRAYECALAHYRALAREQPPKPSNLIGLDAQVFEKVKQMCDWRLGFSKTEKPAEIPPVPLEDMLACLRKLGKSVDFWTRKGGRQGYLQYIEQFFT
jgi:hypothetical protein